MSRINEYLNNIMKAIYGREVRQSIHDAIKEIDAVADTAQGSATEMARAAQQSALDAEASKNASAKSASNAKKSEEAAKKSQEASKLSETNAGTFADNAEAAATAAEQQAAAASNSAAAARASEANAKISETNTRESETNAESSKAAAAASAASASESAFTATSKAEEADDHAARAQSYAVGTHGQVREGDDTDCAGYYYEQTKRISQSLSGVIPMGTITFEGLNDPNNQQPGYLFNISDSFTSDDRFQDGGDIFYGAGNNAMYTADGKWDVLAASMVTGVKGNAEKEYRQGFINLTPANIGALSLTGDAKNNIVSFTSADEDEPTAWTDFALFKSKEKFSSYMNKVSVMAHNLRYFLKMLGDGDISSIGDGTVTGAISSLNTGMTPISIIDQLIYDTALVHVTYATRIGRMIFLHGTIMQQADIEIQFPAGTNLIPLIVIPGQNYDAWGNKDYQCFVGIGIRGNKIWVDTSQAPYHYTIINVVAYI